LNILENYKLDAFNFYLGCFIFWLHTRVSSHLRKDTF